MHAQRAILIAGVALALVYVWLKGGFIAGGTHQAAPVAAAATSERLPDGRARAIFASGCFWSTEAAFDQVQGVVKTTAGYTGGRERNPRYSDVSRGRTGHAEAVEVIYDPDVVSYDALLETYWLNVDPFASHRQFCDVGPQYRPEIFVIGDAQRAAAAASKARVQQRFAGKPVLVAISDAGMFYPAEEYHQGYHQRYATQYGFYRAGCGRDARLAAIWGTERSVQTAHVSNPHSADLR